MILFNDFKQEYIYLRQEIDQAIRDVLESGHYILGEKVDEFEEHFARYLGAKYCVGVANGFEALQIALLASGIKPGDEVITTSLSAAATAMAIEAVGAKPVFVDIDEYYHLDDSKIEEKITEKTKAILPVHLYGQAAAIEELVKIARKHKLILIEDAAQSHGSEYRGRKTGIFGRAGCFSFYPTKNLGAFGDGGAIVTDDEEVFKKCQLLRNYGQSNRYQHEIRGLNSRLDEIQAAILLVKLRHLDEFNQKRNRLAVVYRELLKDLKNVKLPQIREGASHIYHLFVIEAEKRDALLEFLAGNKISCLVHYPISLHKQECFREFNDLALPNVEDRVRHILSLPIHPFLSENDIKFIVLKIKEFYAG